MRPGGAGSPQRGEHPLQRQREGQFHRRHDEQQRDQAQAQGDGEADGEDLDLWRHSGDEPEDQIDEQQHGHERQCDPQTGGEDLGPPAMGLADLEECEGFGAHREGVEALDERRHDDEVTIQGDEGPRHQGGEVTRHCRALRSSDGIEESGEIQAHLEAYQFARVLDGGKHHPNCKADAQTDQHLLDDHAQSSYQVTPDAKVTSNSLKPGRN